MTLKNDIVIITTRGGFMDNKTYELIGVINYLDVVPNFVFPIFKDEKGTLYTSYTNSVDSPYIEGFEPFSSIKRFKDIRVFNRKCDNIKEFTLEKIPTQKLNNSFTLEQNKED